MRAPVRVGLITTSYPRFDGDPAGCFVAEHVRYLEAQGHRVEVIAAGAADGTDGDRVIRIAGGRLFYRGGGPEALERGGAAWAFAARFTARLTAEVARRTRRWDAAIAHWLVPSALAAIAAVPPRRPLLAIAHSGDVHTLRRLGGLGAFAAIAAARPRLRLSFVSREIRDLLFAAAPRLLRPRLAARSQVCPMGIELARLRAGPRDPAARPVVLFLGRLVPIKGALVAAAAARLWRSGARLVVAGAGPEEPALRAAAADAPPGHIELLGEVHGAARDRLLAGADLALVPSIQTDGGRTEGMPMAALEAMAAGAAVIASRVGGLAELPVVTHVAPGDPAALAMAVDRLLASPRELAAQVSAQSRFVADYDWSQVGPRLDPACVRMNDNR
jgi:glycosyltransferase involved in cell wall biosynthesis